MLKIGLTQRVEVLRERNERWDCLDQAWSRLLSAQGYCLVPLPNWLEKVDELIDDLGLEGVILTGGNDPGHLPGAENAAPERDAFERKLLDCCGGRGIPVLGVCRGMQMMVAHHGGEIVPVAGHVGTSHSIMVRSGSTMPLGDRAVVNSYHDFGVYPDRLGPDWQVAGTAPDGSAEAVVHRSLRQWAIMWHPERPLGDERDMDLVRALFNGS